MAEHIHGSLRIEAKRGGMISEISRFLSDLEDAYLELYRVNARARMWKFERRYFRYGGIFPLEYSPSGLTAVDIPPHDRLTLAHVRIESPGFWEVVASLNPLQQIREYLNDRHERRKDREFREESEKERLSLENDLIRCQIVEKENSALRERIIMLREIGVPDDEINRMLWQSLGHRLSKLGSHQDTGLIGKAEKIKLLG